MDTIYSKRGYNMELESNEEKNEIQTVLEHLLKKDMSACQCEEEATINIMLLLARAGRSPSLLKPHFSS